MEWDIRFTIMMMTWETALSEQITDMLNNYVGRMNCESVCQLIVCDIERLMYDTFGYKIKYKVNIEPNTNDANVLLSDITLEIEQPYGK